EAHGAGHMSIWSSRATKQTTVLAATRVGRGALGASLCREPLQYRHIASGSPPRPASHIASVAHVPIYEIGSRSNQPEWRMAMDFSLGSLVGRVLFVVVAILAFVLSRRPTVAQRIVEAIGFTAVFGAAWSVVLLALPVFAPFVIASAAAFGLLA